MKQFIIISHNTSSYYLRYPTVSVVQPTVRLAWLARSRTFKAIQDGLNDGGRDHIEAVEGE